MLYVGDVDFLNLETRYKALRLGHFIFILAQFQTKLTSADIFTLRPAYRRGHACAGARLGLCTLGPGPLGSRPASTFPNGAGTIWALAHMGQGPNENEDQIEASETRNWNPDGTPVLLFQQLIS